VGALGQEGVDARPMYLRRCDRSDIMTEVLDAGAVIVGSPTLNNGLFIDNRCRFQVARKRILRFSRWIWKREFM
jgi:flavorubredoxin